MGGCDCCLKGLLHGACQILTKWRNRMQRWALVPVLSLHVIRARAVGGRNTCYRHSTSSECRLSHVSGDNHPLYSWLLYKVYQNTVTLQGVPEYSSITGCIRIQLHYRVYQNTKVIQDVPQYSSIQVYQNTGAFQDVPEYSCIQGVPEYISIKGCTRIQYYYRVYKNTAVLQGVLEIMFIL